MKKCAGVVLAAGKGLRMRSKLPKLLHQLCGKELLRYPVDALRETGVEPIVVVVSSDGESAARALLGDNVQYVFQDEALGTGHALAQASELLVGQAENIYVLNGDLPLIRAATVEELLSQHISTSAAITLLSAKSGPFVGMAKIVRGEDGKVQDIMETKGLNQYGEASWEFNGGAYCFRASWLWQNLPGVQPAESGEIYITSLISIAANEGAGVETLVLDDPTEVLGINTRGELAQAESAMRDRIRQHWMDAGVTMLDPNSTFLDADVNLGSDTIIYPNTMVLGSSAVGEDCTLGPGSVIRDSQIGKGCRVVASFLTETVVEEDVEIGPYCHLRPGTYLETGVHVGTFGEIKNSRLGHGTAMGHFSYIGDATIGAEVNLGAGTVTCNYDGESKQHTEIGDRAFIGSDTMLVAPVKVGPGAITGAGSVVTKDVPASRLVVGVPAKIIERKKVPHVSPKQTDRK